MLSHVMRGFHATSGLMILVGILGSIVRPRHSVQPWNHRLFRNQPPNAAEPQSTAPELPPVRALLKCGCGELYHRGDGHVCSPQEPMDSGTPVPESAS